MIVTRPSQAHRWFECAAYPLYAAHYPPSPDTDASREGTCAAWVAETVINGDATSAEDLRGETHSNGWVVDDTMVNLVQDYIDLVTRIGSDHAEAEVHVRLSDDPLIEGTTDHASIAVKDRLLTIVDLKYGRIPVEAFENPQLICYGAGVVKQMVGSFDLVQLCIYQPRAFHQHGIFRKWVIGVDDLMVRAARLIEAAKKCYEPHPVATPGEHCIYCPVAAKCQALANATYRTLALIETTGHRDLTPNELGNELDFIDNALTLVKARQKAIEAEAMERASNEYIPGWRLTNRYGNKTFSISAETLQLFTGIDPYDKKLITPAEAKRRGVSDEFIDANARSKIIGKKLERFTSADVEFLMKGRK